MRIFFDSMTLPKKAAKRIQRHFTPTKPGLGEPPPLHRAQEITAVMLGYENWHDLEKNTKSPTHPASPLDEQADSETQQRRIVFQARQLGRFMPVTEPILMELALKFRVSARSPLSESLANDSYRTNSLLFWEPYGEEPEWRFMPSGRSRESGDDLYDLLDDWTDGKINLGRYKEILDATIQEQPENLAPYVYILEAIQNVDAWELTPQYLAPLEAAIENSLPQDYPRNRKVPPLNWGTIENRTYLRSLYYLAQGFYAVGNYKKAKQWFLFLTRCSSVNMGSERDFLADMKASNPMGNIHRNARV